MVYAFLIILPFLSVLKVLVQGATAKNKINSVKDCLIFTGAVSLASALFLSALFLRSTPTREELLFALLYAAFSTGFQFCYVLAFRSGPISVTSTITSFAVVIPIVFGAVSYHTSISVLAYVALGLMAISLLLIPDKGQDPPGDAPNHRGVWLLFTLMAFVFSGLSSSMQVYVSHTNCNVDNVVVFSYYFSAAICLLSAPLILRQSISLRPERSLLIGVPVIAVCLGLYNLLSIQTLKSISATIFYTIVPGSHLILINMVGILLFKEKKTVTQYIGLLLALAAVILIRF